MNCMNACRNIGSFCLLCGSLFFALNVATSCARIDKYRSQRKNIKVEQKLRKAEKKAHDDKIKAHYDMQSDETRAMMNQTKKKNRKFLRQFKKKRY